MAGESSGNVGFTMKIRTMFARRSAHDGMMEDRDEQERYVRASHLSGWTVVKPAKLTAGADSERAQMDATVSVGAGSQVSRAALARLLVQEITTPRFVQQAVFVAER
jgi:hypothetical protein